uniref:Uncharacterized protein n=1 Tax=Gasterosteus aculeatus TaxID=69293 RepID=G3PMF5_GASAC
MAEETEEGGGGFRLIFKYKRTCTNCIASRHCAPIFTGIVTGSRTPPWQDHPFTGLCRYEGSLGENKATAMTSGMKGKTMRVRSGGGGGSADLITAENYLTSSDLSERTLKLTHSTWTFILGTRSSHTTE